MAKNKTTLYRLAEGRSGRSCTIKTGKKGTLTVHDEDKNVRRAIRHCPNQKSIYRDEQDDYAVVESIVFISGILEVPNNQPLTKKFLDSHPSNIANGGSWFESIDEEKEARESTNLEEKIVEIKSAVISKSKEEDGIHELSALVAVFTDSIDEATSLGIESLKREIYNEIEMDPDRFIDDNGKVTIFDDHEIKRRYLVLRGLKDGVIKKTFNNKSIAWKTGEVIATAPISINVIDYFTDYLTTDEGMKVAEEITRRS